MKILNIKTSILSLSVAIVLGTVGCGDSSASHKSSYSSAFPFNAENVARLYIGTYNKPMSFTTIDNLLASGSYPEVIKKLHPNKSIYPDNTSHNTLVATLYKNVFGRAGEDYEIQTWVDKLSDYTVVRDDMWYEFVKSATGKDKITIDNKIEVSRFYADLNKMGDYSLINVTDDYATVEKAKKDIEGLPDAELPIPPPTQSLTNGEDHISLDAHPEMSGDDIIEGKILNGGDTLQSFDGIDGFGGYNIVRATVINGSAATYKNIDEVQFRFAGENGDSEISLQNNKVENSSEPIDIISVIYSNVAGAVTYVAGIDDFRVLRTSQNIRFGHGTATNIDLTVDLTYNYSGLVDINFSESQVQDINIISGYSGFKYLQDTESLQNAKVDVKGANYISFNGGESTLQTIDVTNNGSLDVTPLPLKGLVSFKTASDTAYIRVHVDNTEAATIEEIEGTNGPDFIRVDAGDQAISSTLVIAADKGNDYVIFTAQDASKFETGAQVDGSRGDDILGLNSSLMTSLTQNASANGIDDFETLHILDLLNSDSNLQYVDDIQDVWLLDTYGDNDSDETVDLVMDGLENNAKITFTQAHDEDDNDTLTLTGANVGQGTNDTYTISLDNTFNSLGSDTDFGNIVVNYIETLEFKANSGFISTLEVNATDVRKINSTGSSLLDILPDSEGKTSQPLSSVVEVTAGDGGIRVDISGAVYNQKVVTNAGNDVILLGDTDGDDDSKNVANLGAGNDYLTGGKGVDEVDFGSGNDVYYSSPAKDEIHFGTGKDSYIAREATHSNGTHRDTIDDFRPNEDLVNLSTILKDEGEDEDKCYNNEKKDGTEGPCYLGEADGWDEVLSSLSGKVGETVLDTDSNKIFVDVNGDADIDDNDLVLKVENVFNMSPNDFKFQ